MIGYVYSNLVTKLIVTKLLHRLRFDYIRVPKLNSSIGLRLKFVNKNLKKN